MPLSTGYVARETASNLWRNRLMAIAAILTVGISLSLFGTALLLRQSVNHALVVLGDNVDMQIFMKPTSTVGQTNTIATTWKQTPQIKTCRYLDHQQSYDRMKQLFVKEPLIPSVLTPNQTPPVFLCTLVHPKEVQAVANIFDNQSGVYRVTYPAQDIRSLTTLTNVLQVVLLGLAVTLLLSAVVLILMAIRMAIFARRREVSVMRLVGATAWFIRVPFMMEGLVQGLIGAIVAVGVVFLGDLGIRALLRHYTITWAVVPTNDLIMNEILVVVVGVLIGVIGSAFAIRRFLRT